jgi:hypothetical protein
MEHFIMGCSLKEDRVLHHGESVKVITLLPFITATAYMEATWPPQIGPGLMGKTRE